MFTQMGKKIIENLPSIVKCLTGPMKSITKRFQFRNTDFEEFRRDTIGIYPKSLLNR